MMGGGKRSQLLLKEPLVLVLRGGPGCSAVAVVGGGVWGVEAVEVVPI